LLPILISGTPMSRSRGDALRPQFRELLLPQSDLAHRAQLVVLRQPDASQVYSHECFINLWWYSEPVWETFKKTHSFIGDSEIFFYCCILYEI